MIATDDLEHLAFSILHGTFGRESPGWCSCTVCAALSVKIDDLCKEEADKFYNEHYPPPGGLM